MSDFNDTLWDADEHTYAKHEILSRYLDAWQQSGWHIDLDALAKSSDRKVFAIPGPGRRAHRNWVIDPVPLVPA